MPGKSHGPRSLVGYNPWGRKESDTTERLLCVFTLLGPPQGSFCPVWCCLSQKNETKQKKALFSNERMERGEPLFPADGGWGCIIRFSAVGRGEGGVLTGPQRGLLGVPDHSAGLQRLCKQPAAATILKSGVTPGAFASVLQAGCLHYQLCFEVLGARPLHVAPGEHLKLDKAQRKRKKKKVRFYFITQIVLLFPVIINGLCWWQQHPPILMMFSYLILMSVTQGSILL